MDSYLELPLLRSYHIGTTKLARKLSSKELSSRVKTASRSRAPCELLAKPGALVSNVYVHTASRSDVRCRSADRAKTVQHCCCGLIVLLQGALQAPAVRSLRK